MMIRTANRDDIERIIELLHQVNMVHHVIRPDLFKPHTTKYNAQELESLLGDTSKPIFVYDDGEVQGYAFCQISEVKDNQLLQDAKTLYIDDICVDENARGKRRHIKFLKKPQKLPPLQHLLIISGLRVAVWWQWWQLSRTVMGFLRRFRRCFPTVGMMLSHGGNIPFPLWEKLESLI